jgi:hypothetical protein
MSELAILAGPKTRTEPYPEWPVWDQRDIDAVTEVIKSGRWGGYPYPGPKTTELARKFAELLVGALDENVFRAGPKGVDDAVEPIKKIQRNAAELNGAAEEWRAKHK